MNKPLILSAPLSGRTGHETGRALLAQLYFQQTGMPCPPISITPLGKPYFEDSPLHFSISHTDKHAFCALSPVPVGIDAEEMDRPVNLRLANRVLSPSEKAIFDDALDKSAVLLKLWVLKEAAAKLAGTGIRQFPCHTDFTPDDPRIIQMDGCYLAILTQL